METTRHIGVNLHRNCFTARVRLENGRNYVTEWKFLFSSGTVSPFQSYWQFRNQRIK